MRCLFSSIVPVMARPGDAPAISLDVTIGASASVAVAIAREELRVSLESVWGPLAPP
jgi:hypothetical protein